MPTALIVNSVSLSEFFLINNHFINNDYYM